MIGLRKLIATAATATLLATSATPALARDGWGHGGWGNRGWGGHGWRYRGWRHHGDGIDAGDVILGAIIVGGIAAIASAAANSDRDGRRHGGDWGGGWTRDIGTEDEAVDACARAAEREGARYGRNAQVEDITSVARQDGGYRVSGVIAAERGYSGSRYDDRSRFSCSVRYGQVDSVRFGNDRSAWGY